MAAKEEIGRGFYITVGVIAALVLVSIVRKKI